MFIYALKSEKTISDTYEHEHTFPALYLIRETAEEDARSYTKKFGVQYTVHEVLLDEGFPTGMEG